MKTLVHTTTKESRFVFNDEDTVTITDEIVITPLFNVGDMNSSNAELFSNVTPPEDWIGNKYLFDGTAWTLNPEYKEPIQPE